MILKTIWSGGQTGADLGGWLAAKAAGLETQGWMTWTYMTEDGPRSEYRELYNAATDSNWASLPLNVQYRKRALANVCCSDATICFDAVRSKASVNASQDCAINGKHYLLVAIEIRKRDEFEAMISTVLPKHVAKWIKDNRIESLNVCGNRESKMSGMTAFVEKYMGDVIQILKSQP